MKTIKYFFILAVLSLISCENNDIYDYEFQIVNETNQTVYVRWSIDGVNYLDTILIPNSYPIASVRRFINRDSKLSIGELNTIYSCTVYSIDSMHTWDLSDLTTYSLTTSTDCMVPYNKLYGETYTYYVTK